MSPRNKEEKTTEKKSSPLKMKEEISGKDEMKSSPNIREKIEERRRFLDEHIINSHIEKNEEKSNKREEGNTGALTKIEERRRYLDEHIINSHIEKHEEKSNKREERNKGALTKTNERKVITSEKRIEEKENIPRPRSRNIEKVMGEG